ncbi:MAG: TolC family protein [Desulfobacterales bacterium]|nr:TolC family protein [Desulfobacterales bacterium]
MINRKCIVCCLVVLLFASVSGAAEIFSLKKSIEYGLKHSPLLQSGDIRIDQAEMDVKAQRGRFFPSISTGYSHSRIFSEYASGSVDEDYIDQKNEVVNIRMTQVIFAGFEYKNRFERAKLGSEYQQAQLELQKLDFIYQIKAAFFELLKTRYDVTSITRRIRRLESDLAAAGAFSNRKMAPYVYVLQAEADLEEAKQSLWKTQTSIYRYSERLKRLIGLADPVEFDDLFEAPANDLVMDLDHCIGQALANRPEIRLLNLQTKLTEKDAAIAKGRYYPRVNLEVGLYDADKQYDETSIYLSDRHNTYWSAGVSVQMNLFDGGTAYYENNRYLLEIKRIKTEKQQTEMEIKEQVGVAFHFLAETRNRLVSVEKALVASQENYSRQKKRFNARIGTTSQVLDAQAMLARAESGKSQSLLDCRLALAELHRAMGQVDFQSDSPNEVPGR